MVVRCIEVVLSVVGLKRLGSAWRRGPARTEKAGRPFGRTVGLRFRTTTEGRRALDAAFTLLARSVEVGARAGETVAFNWMQARTHLD